MISTIKILSDPTELIIRKGIILDCYKLFGKVCETNISFKSTNKANVAHFPDEIGRFILSSEPAGASAMTSPAGQLKSDYS